MPNHTELLKRLYDGFNTRDMEAVLATMHRDVVWANGLEGGYVYGRDSVRDHWTRQWATINSHAEPTDFADQAANEVTMSIPITSLLCETAGFGRSRPSSRSTTPLGGHHRVRSSGAARTSCPLASAEQCLRTDRQQPSGRHVLQSSGRGRQAGWERHREC